MRIGSVTVHSSLFAKMASESPEKDLITQSNIVKATDEMIQFEEKTVLDTKTLLAGGMPQAPLICIFQCRLRIPSGRFLSGDVLRVVEDLYEVRSGFCQRSILHLFRDRRIQKRNAPFLHTEKANLNKLRGMQHRKVAHRAYRR